MANQFLECNGNNTVLVENTASVKSQNDDLKDDKICISETAIFINNVELQDHLIEDKLEQYDVSTILDNIKTEPALPEMQYDTIYDNFKIEGMGTDDIKIEPNNGLLYCVHCLAYYEDYCAECEMLVHILNKAGPVNAEELPHSNILEIRDYFGQFHIFALKSIPSGVRFGPFTGLNAIGGPWKVKGGRFVIKKRKSKYLNWMQYVNSTRSIFEQNLLVFQYEHNLYYESTRYIKKGDELLVYFGKEYEDSFNRNVEMDFIPTTEHIFKDAFACTFCSLGFSSKLHLAKHKTICLENAARRFSAEELTQCPSCKIYMDQKEYILHHMAYCCKGNDGKGLLPTPRNRTAQVNERKARPRQLHKCQQCNYRTQYKGDLKNHTNQHYAVKIYKCGICCRRFKTKDFLRLHVGNADTCAGRKDDCNVLCMNARIKAEHSYSRDEMKKFKCSFCEFGTNYKMSLRRHVKVKHIEQFKYKCNACDYKTEFLAYLNTHIETKHLKKIKYKCDTCDYTANEKSHLKKHVEGKHKKGLVHNCDTCDYKSNWKSELKRHIETKHLKEFKYKCDTCDYKSKWKASLNAHIKTRHLNEFKYKCNTCDYKTNRKGTLEIHIGTKHLKEFKYKCDRCDYKSNVKSRLEGHARSNHLKEFKHKCDACDYKTNLKSSLKTHIQTRHLKEFKYKCDACDYETNWKNALQTHTETKHLKEFKYKCDLCDYKANLKSALKAHVETRHLKRFKYKCDKCNYKTNQKLHLTIHVIAKHLNEFNYNCGICDYKTNRKDNLRAHVEVRQNPRVT